MQLRLFIFCPPSQAGSKSTTNQRLGKSALEGGLYLEKSLLLRVVAHISDLLVAMNIYILPTSACLAMDSHIIISAVPF